MRVVVADSRHRVRSALRLLLELEQPLQVAGEATTMTELVQLVSLTRPEIVLLDWELPGLACTGIPAGSEQHIVQTLRKAAPGVLVVALSGRPEARQDALRSGVDMFICKGNHPGELMTFIKKVADVPSPV